MTADDEPTDSFFETDAMKAYVTSDFSGGYLCVSAGEVSDPEEASCSARWGKPHRVVGIGSQFLPYEGPLLPIGTWQLLAMDQNMNKLHVSEVFVVDPCTGCPMDVGLEASQQWKADASEMRKNMGGMCVVAAGLEAAGGAAGKGAKEAVKKGMSAAGKQAWEMHTGSDGGGGDSSFSLPTYSPPIGPGGGVALSILHDLACGAHEMYDDIVNDPADPNYQTVEPAHYDAVAPTTSPAVNDLFAALDRQFGDGDAALTAYERYLGATAAGDAAFGNGTTQLRAVAETTYDQVEHIHDAADGLRAYATVLNNSGELQGPISSEPRWQTLRNTWARIAASGFAPAEVAQLSAMGVSSADMDAMRTHFMFPTDGIDPSVPFTTYLTNTAAAIDEVAESLLEFGITADNTAQRRDLSGPPEPNHAPLAQDDAVTAQEDHSATVDVLANDSDPDGDPLSLTGSTQPSNGSVFCNTNGCTYSPNSGYIGTDSFTYTIADDGGLTDTGTVNVTVTSGNHPPIVQLPADQTLEEGQAFTVTANVVFGDGRSPANYDWDPGDGTGTQGTGSPSLHYVYNDNGSYTLTLTAKDDAGETGSDSMVVTATNVAPNVSFSPDFTRTSSGVTKFLSMAAYDQGSSDALSYSWDFGDGTTGTGQSTSHAWAAPGTYTIVAKATDDDGATGTAQATITVADVVADAGPDVSTTEGESAAFGGPGTSTGDPNLTYSWDFGDGSATTTTPTPFASHTYLDTGTYTTLLTVSDGTTTATDTATVTVANAPPVVAGLAAPDAMLTNQTKSFRLFAAEPGGAPVTVNWDFGDGTTATGEAADHVFSAAGDFLVKATAVDDENSQVSTTRHVAVAATDSSSLDSSGREFWIAFDKNTAAGDPELTLYVTSPVNTSGFVRVPGLGFEAPFTVSGGEVTPVTVPVAAMLGRQDGLERLAIQVTSLDEVVVYGLNRRQFTTDAYLSFPTDTLGTRYRVLSYGGGIEPLFSVVASRNNTDVTVTLVDGTVITKTLNLGEAYEYRTTHDVTGAVVTSTKPVSVFGGVQCANIPDGFGFCDHIVEQLLPTQRWGRQFVTAPLVGRTADTIRLVGDEDGTEITVSSANGTDHLTLGAGEIHDISTGVPTSYAGNKPFAVVQYSNGSSFDNTQTDPFMTVQPAFEQFQTSYTVATPPSGFKDNFINFVVPTAGINNVVLDGTPLNASDFTPIPGAPYSGLGVRVEPGTHRITSQRPIGVTVYGFDDFDSYGYIGGMNLGAVATVSELVLTPETQTKALGSQACVEAKVLDDFGGGVPAIRVDLAITGVNPGNTSITTDNSGAASYCYTGSTDGTDTVTGLAAGYGDTATILWGNSSSTSTPTTTPTTVPSGRRPTTLIAHHALVDLGGPNPVPLTAAATLLSNGAPVPGQNIIFTAGMFRELCHATTDANGYATCQGIVSAVQATLNFGYEATYRGNATYLPSTSLGGLIGIPGVPLP